MWHSTGWFLDFFLPIRFGHKSGRWGTGLFLGDCNFGACFVNVLLVQRLRHVPLGWTLSITVLILNKILNKGLHIHFALGSTKYVSRLRFQLVCIRKSEQWTWGSSVAPTACTWQAEGPDVRMPTEEGKMGWMEARARMKTLTVCVRLEIRAWDNGLHFHGSQNAALADGTGPHNSVVADQRPDQRAKGLRNPRSNGRTWIPHHLLPHDLEDHVSQQRDL